MPTAIRPMCKREPCFANVDGCCAILTDNYFGSRPCPFYKDARSVEPEYVPRWRKRDV